MSHPDVVTALVRQRFAAVANPDFVAPMAAYMKTKMPFWGIKKPERVPVYRELKRDHAPRDHDEYVACVGALWAMPHREEKYAAIEFAIAHRAFIGSASLPLYERMIREGAWWDLVDPLAANAVGAVWLKERSSTEVLMDRWIDDDDMWIRRTALIGQLRHKADLDRDRLFRYCRRRAHEKEFFIRKAIGWALRDCSYSAPEAVQAFLQEHGDELSGLSRREGSKHLVRSGLAAR